MSSAVVEEIDIQKALEFDRIVSRATEEAVNLRVVEKFFAEIERSLLKISPKIFDIAPVKRCLEKLKSATEESSPGNVWQAEFLLQQELYLWRNLLEERDRHIETYHFRRFCDSAKETFEPAVYVALTLFYRNLAYSPSSQSKLDLFVTRLFTRESKNNRRKMTVSTAVLSERLNNLFENWGFESPAAKITENDINSDISGIDAFVAEAEQIENFEQLVKCELPERYRVFKRKLGKRFFEPRIIAAAVRCNAVVGNTFNALLERENEALGTKITSEFDFAGALSDLSPDAQNHIFDYIREITTSDVSAYENEDLNYLWKLLDHSSVSEKTTTKSDENESPYAFDSPSAEQRLTTYFRLLSSEKPDARPLRKYMDGFESLLVLDLRDFLYKNDGSPDFLCRRALGVILWSEEIRQTEFRSQKVLSTVNKQEVVRLMQKSDELANQIEAEIGLSEQETQNRLLIVLNRLLETRIKLERAVVRISSCNPARINNEAKNNGRVEHAAVDNVILYSEPSHSVGKWMTIIVAIAAIIGSAVYFFLMN